MLKVIVNAVNALNDLKQYNCPMLNNNESLRDLIFSAPRPFAARGGEGMFIS
ncbi:MAG: hypothetical protein WC785_03740 [Tatlockia sp.]